MDTRSGTDTPADPGPGGVSFRPAEPRDLDALLAIEATAFEWSRISRRSFRHFLTSPRAILRIAETGGKVVGYHLVLFRSGTASVRLYSL